MLSTSEPEPTQSEDCSGNEIAAGELVRTALVLLMEDDASRGYLDLQRWLRSELDQAYMGGPL